MTGLRVALVLGLLAGSAAGARAAQAQAEPPPHEPDLTRWLEAVEAHTPGFNDSALAAIKPLSPQTFSQVRRALVNQRKARSVESFNRLVHRGAVMHMDAAMVLADAGGSGPLRRPGSPRSGATTVLSSDGGFRGFDITGIHWEYGRALIDLTSPLPSEDETARLWYVASAAFMANRSLLAELTPHLDRGRKIFPNDPDILFASGCYYEAVSSPSVRSVIESTDLPQGIHIAAPSARESWRQADYYFQRAIEGRPGFAAARVRRARALHMLGRHREALVELHSAVTLTADPALLYYVALFEGAAQEALDDMTAARASYQRAATAFPKAQSPYVALSRIARAGGDRATAQAAMAQVFAQQNRGEADDPWWTYYFWFVRNADELFARLRQALVPAGAQPDGARK